MSEPLSARSMTACAVVYGSIALIFGTCLAIVGPMTSLLAKQTGVTEADLGPVLGMSGIGMLVGGVPSGWVMDRLPGHPVLAVLHAIQAVCFFILPSCKTVFQLAAVYGTISLTLVVVNTALNSMSIWLLTPEPGKEKPPLSVAFLLNATSVGFGVGALAAPQLVHMMTQWTGNGGNAFYAAGCLLTVASITVMLLPASPRPGLIELGDFLASACPFVQLDDQLDDNVSILDSESHYCLGPRPGPGGSCTNNHSYSYTFRGLGDHPLKRSVSRSPSATALGPGPGFPGLVTLWSDEARVVNHSVRSFSFKNFGSSGRFNFPHSTGRSITDLGLAYEGHGAAHAHVSTAASPASELHLERGLYTIGSANYSTIDETEKKATANSSNNSQDAQRAKWRIPFIFFAMVIIFANVSIELGYGNWVFTYCVRQAGLNEVQGQHITSIFWLSFTLGRVPAMIMTSYVSVSTIMAVTMPLALVGATLPLLLPFGTIPHDSPLGFPPPMLPPLQPLQPSLLHLSPEDFNSTTSAALHLMYSTSVAAAAMTGGSSSHDEPLGVEGNGHSLTNAALSGELIVIISTVLIALGSAAGTPCTLSLATEYVEVHGFLNGLVGAIAGLGSTAASYSVPFLSLALPSIGFQSLMIATLVAGVLQILGLAVVMAIGKTMGKMSCDFPYDTYQDDDLNDHASVTTGKSRFLERGTSAVGDRLSTASDLESASVFGQAATNLKEPLLS